MHVNVNMYRYIVLSRWIYHIFPQCVLLIVNVYAGTIQYFLVVFTDTLRVPYLYLPVKLLPPPPQTWLKRRRERREQPPVEVLFNKNQEQVTVRVPLKVGKEALEHSEKTPLLSERTDSLYDPLQCVVC